MRALFSVYFGMARKLRYVPEGGGLFEITCRTLQGRLLFRPGPELNEIFVGVLARAQRLYGVSLCAAVCLSNHFHLLAWVEDALQLSSFMRYLNSNLGREIARLRNWPDKVFSRRYQAILVSNEEGAQVDRLKYLLSHGCKEDLVARPGDWPGVHCVDALILGIPLKGYWFDRTQEFAARCRREDYDRFRYATEETLVLDPLPCWSHLSLEQYRRRVLALIEGIEEEATVRRRRTGARPLGREAVLGQDPHHRPAKLKKSPAPFVHAVSKAVRREFWEAYSWVVAAYRKAAERLSAGDREAVFPPGCFPPALPFVGG
jgi:REP element-mobilizing transposase RayT